MTIGAFQSKAFQLDFQQGLPLEVGVIPNLAFGLGTGGGSVTTDLSVYFIGAASYSITGLPGGGAWAFNTATGVLTTDTSTLGTFGPLQVTATNPTGDTVSNTFTDTISSSTVHPFPGFAPFRRGFGRYQ